MTLTPLDRTTLAVHPETSVPRHGYPRPDRDRSDRWLTLNGTWDFQATGAPNHVVVPFAWETEASGVHRTWLEKARYSRPIEIPDSWRGSRIILCFGAVHHHAVVEVDETVVGEHSGGYEYFEFDITDALGGRAEAEVSVLVTAPADKREIPHGKQRSIPRDDYDGVSFTPTSGIWQSVWLEARGRTFARSVSLRGDSLTGFDAEVALAGDQLEGAHVTLTVLATSETVTVRSDRDGKAKARLDLGDPLLWSPSSPHLYEIRVDTETEMSADSVVVTSGLRRFETRGEELLLNGERVYLRGVLDQGYWPHTGLTAPTDDDLLHDIALAAELGYNLVRKHLKFEEPIWLHEADKRGMLVWAEPACPSRYSTSSADAFMAQLGGMVERDGNHPSIVIWGLYNEEWGLDWDIPGSSDRATAARRAYDHLRELDDTRPVVENSGWSHVKTDLVDWHYYEPDIGEWADAVAGIANGDRDSFPVRLAPDFTVDKSLYADTDVPRTGIPIVNSEYGEGFTSLERMWHLRWETQELRRHDRFAGYVYTEFADVEHEAAGLLTGDRRLKDGAGCRAADVNAETTLVINIVPAAAGADLPSPVDAFELGLHVSHHGQTTVTGRIVAEWIAAGSPLPTLPSSSATIRSEPTSVEPFLLSQQVSLLIPAQAEPARLALSFVDDSGRVRARSFIDAAVVERPNRRGVPG